MRRHHSRVTVGARKRQVPWDEVVGLGGALSSLNPSSSSSSGAHASEHCSSSQRFSRSALSSVGLVSRERVGCGGEEAAWWSLAQTLELNVVFTAVRSVS